MQSQFQYQHPVKAVGNLNFNLNILDNWLQSQFQYQYFMLTGCNLNFNLNILWKLIAISISISIFYWCSLQSQFQFQFLGWKVDNININTNTAKFYSAISISIPISWWPKNQYQYFLNFNILANFDQFQYFFNIFNSITVLSHRPGNKHVLDRYDGLTMALYATGSEACQF